MHYNEKYNFAILLYNIRGELRSIIALLNNSIAKRINILAIKKSRYNIYTKLLYNIDNSDFYLIY